MTVAKVGIAATGAIATGIGVLTKQAVENYAEYEQLVGGVETLFKDSSGAVLKYANNAYKTAGLSANEYMETVTSFSASLLQSLDGDTAKAAEKADLAITDMSDNANKMGTSMESIQTAYQGFAKQNYTMLDNLKLGYGGTKEEMQRLLNDAEKLSGVKYDLSSYSDLVDAIHVVQTEIGITGTTAKEASSTIQGSIGQMKAAWTNFLTGMADPDQDFDALLGNLVDSIVAVADNLIPRIAATLPRLVQGLMSLATTLGSYLPEILQKLLPSLITGAGQLLAQLVTGIPALLQALLPMLVDSLKSIFSQAFGEGVGDGMGTLLDTIMTGFSQIGGMLQGIMPSIVSMISQVIPPLLEIANAILPVWVELITTLLPPLTEIITAIIPVVVSLISQLLPPLLQIVQAVLPLISALLPPIMATLQLVISAISPIITLIAQLVSGIATALTPVIQGLCDFLTGVLTPIINTLSVLINTVISWVVSFISQNMGAIQAIFQSGFDIISGIVQFFTAVFQDDWSGAWDAVISIVQAGIDFVMNIFNLLDSFISSIGSTIWNFIVESFTNIKNSMIQLVMDAINWVIDKFNSLPDPIKNVLSVILGVIYLIVSSVITKLQQAHDFITNIFNVVKTFISSTVSNIWSIVTNAFENVRLAIVNKLNQAKDSVLSIFENIRSTINEKIEAAKSIVSAGVQALKDFFNFEWELPKIKLPHFSISGKFGLDPPSIPSFGVEWYKNGGIMLEPTAFGINPKTGSAMVGGEAGAEAIAPISTLQKYVSDAVAGQNAELVEVLNLILQAIYTMDGGLGTKLYNALLGMKFQINEREFARLVKAV